jgi:uncharacterized protein (TIGR03437 family)
VQKFVGICLALAGSAWGQSPTITHVVTTGPFDTSFAPGTTVYIFGTFAHPAAGRDFTINVGGQSGGINVADNGVFITAQIPVSAPTGPQSLTVTYLGQSSNSLPVAIAQYAPEFGGRAVTLSGGNAFQFGPYYPFTHNSTSSPCLKNTFL